MTGIDALPYRGMFGDRRPDWLDDLPLPPQPMPSHDGVRPLKSWRYVGAFGAELMVCIGSVRIGRARQAFWAVWDPRSRTLHERTALGAGGVTLAPGQAAVRAPGIRLELALEEAAGVEIVSASGESYAWTRKQGGVRARATVAIGGELREVDLRAVIDDTAGYYERHTRWRWSAGAGETPNGRVVAWNLVSGVHDAPQASERTVWIDGEPREVGPCTFGEDRIDNLRFAAEAVRERRENFLVLRSRYRQPFGTFSGELPGGLRLASGYGVLEDHEAWW